MPDDPPWMIEKDERDPGASFLLSFSDEIAHDRDDLVARAEAFVGTLPGVTEAFQEDRELILVRAPGVEPAAFEARFTEWWRRVARESPPWAQLLAAIAAAVHPVAEAHGFRKRKHVFNRETDPGIVQVIDLYRVDDAVRIEAGIYIEPVVPMIAYGDVPAPRPAWVGEPHCHIRGIATLDDGTGPHAVPLDGGAAEAAQYVEDSVLPALETLRSVEDLVRSSERGTRRIGRIGNEPLVIAAILALRDDLDGSRRVLQERFERALPRQRPWIIDRAHRFGVAPLTTGTDPALSVEDEAVLAAWITGAAARIEVLRRLIADRSATRRSLRRRGLRRPEMDGSLGSLSGLWEWLIDVVDHPDTIRVDAEPLARRYRGYDLPRDPGLAPAVEALIDLVAAYVGVVVVGEVPAARWGLDDDAALSLCTADCVPVLEYVRREVRHVTRRSQVDTRALRKLDPLVGIAEKAIETLTR